MAQKYFTGTPGTEEREKSLKDLVDRVADTITRTGTQEGYFETDQEAEDYREELKYILATQRAADMFAENLGRYLRAEPMINEVQSFAADS